MPQARDGRAATVNFARQTLKLYWWHTKQNKRQFFVATTFIPVSALFFATIVPYYLSQAIANLASAGGNITRPLLFATVAGLLGTVANYVGFTQIVQHEAKMLSSLVQNTAQVLVHKDADFFANQKIGALTSKYIEFINNYVKIQDLLIVRTLSFIIAMGTGVVIVTSSSWLLGSLLLIFTVFVLIQIRITMKIRTPYRKKRKELRAQIIGEVADGLTNSVVVKTFAKEENELAATREKALEHEVIYNKDIGIVAREGTFRNTITSAFQIGIIGLSIVLVKNNAITLATAIFSLTYLQRVASQIFTLGEMVNGYDNAFLEAAPMTEILLEQTRVNDVKNAKRLKLTHGEINFLNATYKYEGDNLAIKNFSLKIKPGEKIGLVGHSGAGKTTITKLLLRFDDLFSGDIMIDSQSIKVVTQQSLREHIAYVPQEPMLFHRSLRENISYADLQAPIESVRRAAEIAHAHEFIKDLPKGYETIVGERGVKLSGGQRQRIAIARAILKDAPILLLDEATSALDSENEMLIQDALWKLMEGRTAIVIAHRLSTIQKMDRIIVLDKGRIVEEGSHKELLKRNGMYAKLWAHQSGGFIEEQVHEKRNFLS